MPRGKSDSKTPHEGELSCTVPLFYYFLALLKLGKFEIKNFKTGIDRGGGREFVLVNSCDAIISVSGGSGTLTEIAIAYQSNIPMIAIKNTGGWSDKLAGTFIDERKRLLVEEAGSAKEAVKKAIALAKR
ncbi:MAG: hypothetical protein Q7S86_01480 [bacterium]|nr:hypothetical protein [bacterium]